MNLLVLGGTIFLGRHVVEHALARGHDVTIFHRGKHGADLFPEVERILGDRDGGIGALAGREWDAAVDTSGYVPRVVGASAGCLADTVGHYSFVSSLSVYADDLEPGQDESGPLATLDDETVEEVTGETYGGLKALCERAVEAALPGRALVVRPGLIVGPHDPTDRFTYWPVRVARGGDVLAPAPADGPAEFTDVRDLAAFLVGAAEAGTAGVMNVTGPGPEKTTIGALLDACRAAAGSDARFVWADEETLAAEGVGLWSDMPLYVGTGMPGFATRRTDRALAAGLAFRPIAETVRDTLEWARTLPADHEWRAGLTAEREAEVLARIGRAGGGEGG
ncbi:MAG: NAD-dependent epimerase/dehydratase family protein [Planctomycetota bacterium]|jgi:2'-hydroxyisoflavone reductase